MIELQLFNSTFLCDYNVQLSIVLSYNHKTERKTDVLCLILGITHTNLFGSWHLLHESLSWNRSKKTKCFFTWFIHPSLSKSRKPLFWTIVQHCDGNFELIFQDNFIFFEKCFSLLWYKPNHECISYWLDTYFPHIFGLCLPRIHIRPHLM